MLTPTPMMKAVALLSGLATPASGLITLLLSALLPKRNIDGLQLIPKTNSSIKELDEALSIADYMM